MTVVSLFSGAGGFDLGLLKAGHSIIWANDSDPDCCQTYAYNIGNHIVCKNIEAVSIFEVPDADVIVGGFPCQGFSHANRVRHELDERNKLYQHFLRIVSGKKPLYFLAENVRGILSLGGGKIIQKIVEDFEEAGYSVYYRLLQAANFGVPQSRLRVIIAGTRSDLPPEARFQFPDPTHASPETAPILGLKPWVSISDALAEVPEPCGQLNDPNHVGSNYKVTNRNFTGHRRTDPGKPSPTILARGNGKGGVCAIQHPRNHRRMTIRESAIIQSFPEDFLFFGKLGSCYRQVGNAVPVQLAKALGESLNASSKATFSVCA